MSTDHEIQQGECLDSVAERYGFFWETLWEHADNSELKRVREDPNVLQPGDIVKVPDLEEGEESCATEQAHRFRRKGVPAVLRLVFHWPVPPEDEDASGSDGGGGDAGGGAAGSESDESVYEEAPPEQAEAETEPIADAPYMLTIDGVLSEGRSDADGKVEISIPPSACEAKIRFHPGAENEVSFTLQLGHMDSIDTVIGVRKRLCNLGYVCPPEGDEMDADLQAAIARFQEQNDLEVSGEVDQATKDKLVEVHGS